MEGRWTLDELTARMQAVLGTAGIDAAKVNGQVGEVPNARTIRYYTTIGLVDRPTPKGRVATYGRRHLEQLIAIKRLQAQGKVLADIAGELVGLDDAKLAALAALPDDVERALHGPAEKVASRRERSFWSADVETATQGPARHVTPGDDGDKAEAPARHVTAAAVVTGIQLKDGVTLAVPAARAVDDDDAKALRAALSGVVDILRARGLIGPGGNEK